MKNPLLIISLSTLLMLLNKDAHAQHSTGTAADKTIVQQADQGEAIHAKKIREEQFNKPPKKLANTQTSTRVQRDPKPMRDIKTDPDIKRPSTRSASKTTRKKK